MSESNEPAQAVVILYEVFSGTLPDGKQIMLQVFRRQGQDKSMVAQVAFRDHTWQTWGVPVRLENHQLTANSETPA